MCEGEPECDWIDSQAPWYQLLIMSIQEAETSEALGIIGKAVHERKLTGDKASVFWTFYNNRKAWLSRRFIVREKALEMAARIERAEPAKLGGIGIKLFDLQQGKIRGPHLNKREWSHVWAAYHGRKSQLAAAA
jgi:predicted DNA-binding protein (MmcQ/YjbR family)